MKARIVMVLAVGMALAWMPQASAGGGCHAGVTTADATDEGTGMVEMIDACFTPTTLRIDPGDEVTFVSRDPGMTHNVGANLWGHFDDMFEGDAFTAAFLEPGTYPYACNYHPGMTGAIVVGDGLGAGNGGIVDVRSYVPPEPIAVTRSVAARPSPSIWIIAGATGLVLGAVGGFALARRRREPPIG